MQSGLLYAVQQLDEINLKGFRTKLATTSWLLATFGEPGVVWGSCTIFQSRGGEEKPRHS
jgi:hypothetical protein